MSLALVGPLPPLRGGIARHTACLAGALRAVGQDLQLVSFRRQYPDWLYPGGAQYSAGGQPPWPVSDWLDPFAPWAAGRTARRLARGGVRGVILPWWTPYWAPLFAPFAAAARSAGARVVFLVHNSLPHERRPLDGWFTRWALRQADGWVFHSARQQMALQRLLRLQVGAPCFFTPHPPYPPLISRFASAQQARAALGQPAGRPLLLFFGFVRPYKGLSILMDALDCLRQEGLRPYLVVAGEWWGDARGAARQALRSRLGADGLLLDRYLTESEAADWFLAADALVLPYTAGSQSGVLAQAQGCGLPVVATPFAAAGGLPDGVTLAAPGDARSLAEAIQQVLQQNNGRPHQPVDAAAGWQALARTVQAALRMEGG